MEIVVRSEDPRDYHSIAEIHAAAFTYSHGMGEVPLVDVHRHSAFFDPELSLVAEYDGEVIGHVLFSERQIHVGGQPQKAAILSPAAVDPRFQKLGAGSLIIREGLRRLQERGFQFSVLLGHPEYYSRFGYLGDMYGTCQVKLSLPSMPSVQGEPAVAERRVQREDVPALISMWMTWFADVDLAVFPGRSLIDWISPGQKTTASVLEENGDLLGYIRYDAANPGNIKMLLAKDRIAVKKIVDYLRAKTGIDQKSGILLLPVHPDSEAVKTLLADFSWESVVETWDAGMICVLNDGNEQIKAYCREVREGTRKAGNVIWPVEFDVC